MREWLPGAAQLSGPRSRQDYSFFVANLGGDNDISHLKVAGQPTGESGRKNELRPAGYAAKMRLSTQPVEGPLDARAAHAGLNNQDTQPGWPTKLCPTGRSEQTLLRRKFAQERSRLAAECEENAGLLEDQLIRSLAIQWCFSIGLVVV
jgi:hypothetical protein